MHIYFDFKTTKLKIQYPSLYHPKCPTTDLFNEYDIIHRVLTYMEEMVYFRDGQHHLTKCKKKCIANQHQQCTVQKNQPKKQKQNKNCRFLLSHTVNSGAATLKLQPDVTPFLHVRPLKRIVSLTAWK